MFSERMRRLELQATSPEGSVYAWPRPSSAEPLLEGPAMLTGDAHEAERPTSGVAPAAAMGGAYVTGTVTDTSDGGLVPQRRRSRSRSCGRAGTRR